MRYHLRTLLILPSLACFAAAYRFASHGISGQDKFCIGLASISIVTGTVLFGIALWKRPVRSAATDQSSN
jgi:hypothetical protein